MNHDGKTGKVALDQQRTTDQAHLSRAMGDLAATHHEAILAALADFFDAAARAHIFLGGVEVHSIGADSVKRILEQ